MHPRLRLTRFPGSPVALDRPEGSRALPRFHSLSVSTGKARAVTVQDRATRIRERKRSANALRSCLPALGQSFLSFSKKFLLETSLHGWWHRLLARKRRVLSFLVTDEL